MDITWLGTACALLEYPQLRLLTDPVFDPPGTRYDFGPWYTPASWFASEKRHAAPLAPATLGTIDAVLLSHDHHADNLDHAGREFLRTPAVQRILTTTAGAARLARPAPAGRRSDPGEGLSLGAVVEGLRWGERTVIGSGTLAVEAVATPARHGPAGLPQVNEVCGFYLAPRAPDEPRVWISGDTVLCPALLKVLPELRERGVDVAVLHAGGVCFPDAPLVGKALFTFDAAQVVEVCRALDPATIVPIHHSGWLHFREQEESLRRALAESGFGTRTRWLEPGRREPLGKGASGAG